MGLLADPFSSSIYSDDDGKIWTQSTGSPTVTQSTVLNRQDGLLYTTDGSAVLVSNNGGQTFTSLQSFGGNGDAALYSPRYNVQQDKGK